MDDRVRVITQDVGVELAEHLAALERNAIRYAAAYAEWVETKSTPLPPHYPREMHPLGAKMIRELVLDRAALP